MEGKFNFKEICANYVQALKNHQTLEHSCQEKDIILDGLLKVIQMFVQRFYEWREDLGKELLPFLLHDCLY